MVAASVPFCSSDRGPIAALQRFVVCALLALLAWLPASSFASIPTQTLYQYKNVNIGTSDFIYSSPLTACQATLPILASGTSTYSVEASQPTNCYIKGVRNSDGYVTQTVFSILSQASCPANSTLSGGSCVCTPPAIEDTVTGTCGVPAFNPCESLAGTTSTFNVTSGYARSSQSVLNPPLMPDGSAAAAGYVGIPPTTMCVNGCQRTRGAPVQSWTSTEPTATGLYRMSDDWQFTATATQCTQSVSETAALDPVAAVPGCTGFLGEVNGKKMCVSASAGTTNMVQAVPKDSFMGNPAAGSGGGSGGIPSTGGNGANGGGPVGSGDGNLKKADGTVIYKSGTTAPPTGAVSAPAAGTEQAACGAPGQPKCGIDETGTPVGEKDYGQKGIGEGFDSLKAALESAVSGDGKDTGWGLVPSWLQSSGSCSPTVLWTLPPNMNSMQVTLDLCPHLPMIYTLMNLLWVAWTFFAITEMVFRVTTK